MTNLKPNTNQMLALFACNILIITLNCWKNIIGKQVIIHLKKTRKFKIQKLCFLMPEERKARFRDTNPEEHLRADGSYLFEELSRVLERPIQKNMILKNIQSKDVRTIISI